MRTLPTPRIPEPDTAPALNWGILGAGGIARRFTAAVNTFTASRVAAVGSRTPDKGEAFAAAHGIAKSYTSYEQLVSDPEIDAVYVATTHNDHHTPAALALEAGKPVLVEKAFTLNSAQANAVVELARERNLALMEAMWTRFLPRTDIVRQLLADGTLGEIFWLEADHGQPLQHVRRLTDPTLGGGALLDLGVYPISYAVFALGIPSGVRAVGEKGESGADAQDFVLLDGFADHPRAKAAISCSSFAKTPTTASICGADARVFLPGDFYTPGVVELRDNAGWTAVSPMPTLTRHLGMAYEAAEFARVVKEGRTESTLMPWAETLAVMGIMDECRRQMGVVYPGE
ncbi:MAG: Gfo/Idh/MocA family oxidoreductase [Propionibacteriaceae bacterium]|jgi:predicted dehydrogenase|nr:Gfo/Idh/MocA family oxidoreductase [Propionibacteriaceae bacterium]